MVALRGRKWTLKKRWFSHGSFCKPLARQPKGWIGAGHLHPLCTRDPRLGFPHLGATGKVVGPQWGSSDQGQRRSPLLWDRMARDGDPSPQDRREAGGGQDSQGGYNQPCCIRVTGMED